MPKQSSNTPRDQQRDGDGQLMALTRAKSVVEMQTRRAYGKIVSANASDRKKGAPVSFLMMRYVVGELCM